MTRIMNASVVAQIDKDLENRTINGFYIYTLAWLLVGLGTGFEESSPTDFWIVLSVFLALGLVRTLCFFNSDRLRAKSRYLWLGLMFFNAASPGLCLGIILSLSLITEEYGQIFLYILMMVFAFISAGTMTLAPNKMMTLAYILSITMPPLYTSLFLSSEHTTEALMLIVFSIVTLAQSRRLNREYMQLVHQQQTLKELNNQDSLTGISNRRHFDEMMSKIWNAGARTQATISLLLIDIDHFKSINDAHGHTAGDKVIQSVAHSLSDACKRETDNVARIGGEEFAIILTGNDLASASDIAEKIRLQVENQCVKVAEHNIQITISGGLASAVITYQKDMQSLFSVADKCLYAAKENGRNQIVAEQY